MMEREGDVVQQEVNAEILEGMSELFQILNNSPVVDALPREDAPSRYAMLETLPCPEVDAPPKEDAPSVSAMFEASLCPEVDAPSNEDAPSSVNMVIEDPQDIDFDLDSRIPPKILILELVLIHEGSVEDPCRGRDSS